MTLSKRSYTLQNLVDALDVLGALIDSGPASTLTKLADQVGLDKNKAFRVLATLEERGIVEKGERGEYRFSSATFATARRFLETDTINRQAHPVMEELACATGEAVYLATVNHASALLVEMVDSRQAVKAVSLVGREFRLGRSARVGEVVVDRGGLDREVTTLTALVRTRSQEVAAALVVVVPNCRVQNDRMEQLSRLAAQAAGRLSEFMGGAAVAEGGTTAPRPTPLPPPGVVRWRNAQTRPDGREFCGKRYSH